ncbi:MAG TPA: lysylphosphatidylglycerol synthase transmembrane domain-containing protein, partial [Aggregatilineales bacterium]|nr:lysylphosphatidylglycerol synthase transmembrane domain-containing protein [Aggregatilineales bacterium]
MEKRQVLLWFRRPSVIVGIAVSILSIALLGYLVNVRDLIAHLEAANVAFVVPGLVLAVLGAYLRALRWRAMFGNDVPYWNAFHAENVGGLLNSILPLRAGEAARAYMLSKAANARSLSALEALSSVVVIRIADALATVALFGLLLPALDVPDLLKAAGYSLLGVAVLAALVVIVGAFARTWLVRVAGAVLGRLFPTPHTQRLLAWLDSFMGGLTILRNPRRLLMFSALTIGLWAAYVLFYWVVMMAFWPSPPLAWGVLATCTATLGLALPSSPAGIGVFEAAVAFAMTPYLQADTAAAYAIVVHAS